MKGRPMVAQVYKLLAIRSFDGFPISRSCRCTHENWFQPQSHPPPGGGALQCMMRVCVCQVGTIQSRGTYLSSQ